MKEWSDEFHGLYPFSKNKLYKIAGPFIIGLELVKIPRIEACKPYFVIYPLYGKTVKDCWRRSLFLMEFKNSRGRQFEIWYNDKFGQLQLAHEFIKAVLPFNLNEPCIDYDSFIELIDYYLYKYDHGMFRKHSGNRANMFEIKFYAALYANKNTHVILEEINIDKESWDMILFNNLHGDYHIWYNKLVESLNKLSLLSATIDKNKTEKKIERFPVSELL